MLHSTEEEIKEEKSRIFKDQMKAIVLWDSRLHYLNVLETKQKTTIDIHIDIYIYSSKTHDNGHDR